LIEVHADRSLAARRARAAGHVPLAYVGADVPRELVVAAGFLPLRLAGDPRVSLADERILGAGVDPVARTQLCNLLRQGRALFDRLILSHDGEGSVRLFHALRELQRCEPERALPELCFYDFLHRARASTQRYDRLRLQELVAVLERWSGRSLGERELAWALRDENEKHRLLRQLRALRAQLPARVRGAEALALIGASTALPTADFNALLERALHELGERVAVAGTRVFVTGSDWDHPAVYAAIEARGCVVVGEDHDWGDRAIRATPIAIGAGDTLSALAEHYLGVPPAARLASSAARARDTLRGATRARAERVLCVLREGDAAPAWDLPEQRARLAAGGLPFAVVPAQPYAGPHEASLIDALEAA